MKQSLVLASLLVGLAAAGFAQSNAFMDAVLDSKAITAGQASYLALVASDKLGDDSDAAAAFAKAQELGWAPKAVSADAPASYSSYAYLLMRAFDMKGGLMYSIVPSPRYAYRELVARQLIQGRSDPQAEVDGLAAVRVLNRVLDAEGRSQ